MLEARDVAFEYFHVLYRLKDFITDENTEADEDDIDIDEDKVVVDGFQEVCPFFLCEPRHVIF